MRRPELPSGHGIESFHVADIDTCAARCGGQVSAIASPCLDELFTYTLDTDRGFAVVETTRAPPARRAMAQ